MICRHSRLQIHRDCFIEIVSSHNCTIKVFSNFSFEIQSNIINEYDNVLEIRPFHPEAHLQLIDYMAEMMKTKKNSDMDNFFSSGVALGGIAGLIPG